MHGSEAARRQLTAAPQNSVLGQPLPVTKKNEAGKLLKIYDKDYSCVYDDLPWKELTVWKYKEAQLKDQGLA